MDGWDGSPGGPRYRAPTVLIIHPCNLHHAPQLQLNRLRQTFEIIIKQLKTFSFKSGFKSEGFSLTEAIWSRLLQ